MIDIFRINVKNNKLYSVGVVFILKRVNTVSFSGKESAPLQFLIPSKIIWITQ